MTESRAYITENLWFSCEDCGKQITHHSMHDCFVMNPDILPTLEEWRLVCKMVKKHELSDEEINQIVWQQNLLLGNDDLRKFARTILQKAREK